MNTCRAFFTPSLESAANPCESVRIERVNHVRIRREPAVRYMDGPTLTHMGCRDQTLAVGLLTGDEGPGLSVLTFAQKYWDKGGCLHSR
eukprot:3867419-Prymnesium_polylepis.1